LRPCFILLWVGFRFIRFGSGSVEILYWRIKNWNNGNNWNWNWNWIYIIVSMDGCISSFVWRLASYIILWELFGSKSVKVLYRTCTCNEWPMTLIIVSKQTKDVLKDINRLYS
jgi:hypothetical protein